MPTDHVKMSDDEEKGWRRVATTISINTNALLEEPKDYIYKRKIKMYTNTAAPAVRRGHEHPLLCRKNCRPHRLRLLQHSRLRLRPPPQLHAPSRSHLYLSPAHARKRLHPHKLQRPCPRHLCRPRRAVGAHTNPPPHLDGRGRRGCSG